jgi:hypothetical protein
LFGGFDAKYQIDRLVRHETHESRHIARGRWLSKERVPAARPLLAD